MLFFSKIRIKTGKLLLIFTLVTTNLFAGSNFIVKQDKQLCFNGRVVPETQSSLYFNSADTIKPVFDIDTENKPVFRENNFYFLKQMADQRIDFQINSDITYLSFRNFVTNEAKILYSQAWMMEKERDKLSAQTDSLRKVYANSSDDRKEDLAALILKNESKTMNLNQEIPPLYEKARSTEDNYWKAAPESELTRFQEKIKLFGDSLDQVSLKLKEQQNRISQDVRDTITIFKPVFKASEIKNDQPAGVTYKIQIAAFKSKVPTSAAKLIKKLSIIRQIDNFVDEKGVTIYTTGNLKTYKEAVILQKQIKQEGAKNPTVIAFLNGKKIEVNEAKKINHETNANK